ncbi:hypothetical protein UY3_18772 [Chelonia mydas]|uniref:Uncharacterized protein n=1 Tax=Chelonia mydas TaxID=8469 RepID=M7AN32_CHEMY|nr:hypothetical protein UY3_18772 [Chelonia mydas]
MADLRSELQLVARHQHGPNRLDMSYIGGACSVFALHAQDPWGPVGSSSVGRVGLSLPQQSRTMFVFRTGFALIVLADFSGKVSSVKPEKSAILVLKTVVFTSSKQRVFPLQNKIFLVFLTLKLEQCLQLQFIPGAKLPMRIHYIERLAELDQSPLLHPELLISVSTLESTPPTRALTPSLIPTPIMSLGVNLEQLEIDVYVKIKASDIYQALTGEADWESMEAPPPAAPIGWEPGTAANGSFRGEVLKEQHSDVEATEPKPPTKKINLLLVASDLDDDNEHASVRTVLDSYRT